MYDSTNHTQNLTLGVDTGSGTIGTAVADNNGKIVYMSEVSFRNLIEFMKVKQYNAPTKIVICVDNVPVAIKTSQKRASDIISYIREILYER